MPNGERNCDVCGLPIEGRAVPVRQRATMPDLRNPVEAELIGDVVLHVHPEHFDLSRYVEADEDEPA